MTCTISRYNMLIQISSKETGVIAIKVFILLIVVLDVSLYFIIHQSKPRTQAVPTPVKPVLYIKENKKPQTKVFRDVCRRWGYEEVGTRYDDIASHPDPYLQWCMSVMKYRILQTQGPDKIIDYVPVVNEMITYKANFVKNGGKYIPTGFVLPAQTKDFLRHIYLPQNNVTYWIQKDLAHRGNIIVPLEDLDLNKPSLVQEYIGNPFLIDGRKFSIGVFVVFSSGNPLRAYVIDSTIEWRFCEKDYYPENILDPATYVTDGQELYDIKFAVDIEPLKTYKTKHRYTSRKAFDTFMKTIDTAPSNVFTQIYDAIQDVLTRNAAMIERRSNPRETFTMDANKKCLLCSHCLTQHQVWLLKQMTQEHLQRGTARLVYPFIQNVSDENVLKRHNQPKSDNYKPKSDYYINLLHTAWLEAKCKQDSSWCFY